MRYSAVSIILAVVLVAGCVQMPGFEEAKTGIPQISLDSPDITISVEPYPVETKAGRNISLYFDVYNKQEAMTVRAFNLSIYDPCVFIDGFETDGTIKVWDNEDIRENKTRSKTTKLKAAMCFVSLWVIGMLCWASVLEWKNETELPAADIQFPRYTYMSININNQEIVFECIPGETFFNTNEVISIKLPENGDTGFYQDAGMIYFCIAGIKVEGWEMSCQQLKEMFCLQDKKQQSEGM